MRHATEEQERTLVSMFTEALNVGGEEMFQAWYIGYLEENEEEPRTTDPEGPGLARLAEWRLTHPED